MTLFTIGYQGTQVEGYIEALLAHKVQVVIDVREVPWSRKKGFSKNDLSASLSRKGIEYIHLKSAGNPGRLRKAAGSIQECLESYREFVDSDPTGIEDVLSQLLEFTKEKKKVCITCFEKDPAECHRSIIAEKLLDHFPRTKVVHIVPT